MPTAPMIVVTDRAGRIESVNPYAEEKLGLRAADLRGRLLWHSLVAEEDALRVEQDFARAIDGEALEGGVTHWQGGEGRRLLLSCCYTALQDGRGGVAGIVVSAIDIGSLRQLQADLGESLDLYQGILDTAVDAIITIDDGGLVQSFNRAAERIFGYRAAEVIGNNVSMLMPSPHRDAHDRYVQNYLGTRRKKIIGIGREVEGLRKDGTRFPLDLAVGEVTMPGRRFFTGIIRDISDRKEAEAELHRRLAELAHVTRLRSMGDLAAGLAHEINQPLTAIISYSQACRRLLSQGRVDVDLFKEAFEHLVQQGERAAEVIRRLRRYVEKGEIDMEANALQESVAEVLGLLSHDLHKSQVQVRLEAPEALPLVRSDRVQIEQVVLNLVRNALDAMQAVPQEARTLQVSLTAAAIDGRDGVEVCVRDSGPGFGDVDPAELFKPFYTTKNEGLGQGLSICKRIVEAHGGRIWAETTAGSGATFRFWLPQG